MATQTANQIVSAFQQFNNDRNLTWSMGTNWDNTGSEFETFVYKYLFPKLSETNLINIDLGNTFNWLAKEVVRASQFSEEYVVLDTVPVDLNLSKSRTLLLQNNFPRLATKLYQQGVERKTKFTINTADMRYNFATVGDAVNMVVGVLRKAISDINRQEEQEIYSMIVDYVNSYMGSLNAAQKRTAVSMSDLLDQITLAMQNIQHNTSKYNEANLAAGGAIGRYTTQTMLKDIFILTTDTVKNAMLNTRIANTFQLAGLDITRQVISFDTLGGTWKTTNQVTINDNSTITLFRAMGDYQIALGDVIPEGAIFTFDVTGASNGTTTDFIASGTGANVTEIQPTGDLFAFVGDINCIRYRRNTQKMLRTPFINDEFDEQQHIIRYYTQKAISPFYNKIVINGNV